MANIKSGLLPLTGVIDGVRGPAGKDGKSPIWIGSDTPPEGYSVWLDPDGETIGTTWDLVNDKPFETLSDDFEVDSEGQLFVVGGTGGASSWEDLENKPFESIGSGLSVTDGVLSSQGGSGSPEIAIGSDTPTGQEVLWIDNSSTYVNVPQIDDANTSLVDTWSSSKIVSEIPVIVPMTEAEYEQITPDPNTYYFIYEA